MTSRTTRPFLKAFALGGVMLIVVVSIMLFGSDAPPPGTPEDAGERFGRILFLTGFPALVTGVWAWKSSSPWSLFRIGLTYFALLAAVVLLTFVGRTRG